MLQTRWQEPARTRATEHGEPLSVEPTRMPGMPGHGTFSMNTASMG